MPSLHDEMMAEASAELLDAFGDRDASGKPSNAVTLIDPAGKRHPMAAILGAHAISEDGAEPDEGLQEWASRGEQIEVKLVGCTFDVTDTWKAEVDLYPGRTFSVERVEKTPGMLLLRLSCELPERIQRRGLE